MQGINVKKRYRSSIYACTIILSRDDSRWIVIHICRSWYSRAISNFVASSTFILPRTGVRCYLFHHPLRFEEDFQLLLWRHADFFREILKLKPWWRSCVCCILFDKLHSNRINLNIIHFWINKTKIMLSNRLDGI